MRCENRACMDLFHSQMYLLEVYDSGVSKALGGLVCPAIHVLKYPAKASWIFFKFRRLKKTILPFPGCFQHMKTGCVTNYLFFFFTDFQKTKKTNKQIITRHPRKGRISQSFYVFQRFQNDSRIILITQTIVLLYCEKYYIKLLNSFTSTLHLRLMTTYSLHYNDGLCDSNVIFGCMQTFLRKIALFLKFALQFMALWAWI